MADVTSARLHVGIQRLVPSSNPVLFLFQLTELKFCPRFECAKLALPNFWINTEQSGMRVFLLFGVHNLFLDVAYFPAVYMAREFGIIFLVVVTSLSRLVAVPTSGRRSSSIQALSLFMTQAFCKKKKKSTKRSFSILTSTTPA